ncbi:MAG: hypothetical protein K2M44_03465 [Clostridia bacterium]|nr:hypothetical protein [Clostridia bacterium]
MKKVKYNYNNSDGKDDANNSAPYSDGNYGQGADNSSDTYNRYAGMSREQLMGEMYKEAAKSRAGGMSNDDLESFYSKVAPAMTEEQRANLRALIEKLKV